MIRVLVFVAILLTSSMLIGPAFSEDPGPISIESLARGILLLYRRNKTNGTWVLKVSDGHGAYWTKGFALADDFEDADGKTVLTFHQAQEQAKKLARGR